MTDFVLHVDDGRMESRVSRFSVVAILSRCLFDGWLEDHCLSAVGEHGEVILLLGVLAFMTDYCVARAVYHNVIIAIIVNW